LFFLQSLWRHVYPAVLRLAVDVDQVARQLFEKLAIQLIHWFTRGEMAREQGGVVTLLQECCLAATTDP